MPDLDVLLHPVRLRLVRAMLDGRDTTTAQLRELMPDIATATLYRHLSTLIEAGVVRVVDEQRVRGGVERRYRIHWGQAGLDDATRASMTVDDHRRAFAAFVGGLLADVEEYLTSPHPHPLADGLSYRQASVWASDEELAALTDAMHGAVRAAGANAPREGRRRRTIAIAVAPRPEKAPGLD